MKTLPPRRQRFAAAASIPTTVYHMLRDGTCYQDLGPEYFTRRNPAQARPNLPTASEISVIMLKSELPHEAPNPVSQKLPWALRTRKHETR